MIEDTDNIETVKVEIQLQEPALGIIYNAIRKMGLPERDIDNFVANAISMMVTIANIKSLGGNIYAEDSRGQKFQLINERVSNKETDKSSGTEDADSTGLSEEGCTDDVCGSGCVSPGDVP